MSTRLGSTSAPLRPSARVSGHGQVLPAMAVLLPIVLLPVAAWTVEASLVAARQAGLVEAAAQAAEDSAQSLDQARFRAGGGLDVLPGPATEVARAEVEADAGARLVAATVTGDTVTVTAEQWVPLSFGALIGWKGVLVHASVTARLASGYESPSSLLPLPARIFSSA